MMLAAHLPVGALAGRRCGNVATAFCAGALTHALLDMLPHDDVVGRRTEVSVASAGVPLIALGTRDARAVAGAIGGVFPDLEHVVRAPGFGGRLIFPTHGPGRLHEALRLLPFRFTARAQVAGAATLLAVLFFRHARPDPSQV